MTAARSLYDEALDSFRQSARQHYAGKDRELQLLEEFLRERASPEETKEAAEALQADAGKKWGSRKVGSVEIPESWIANIMGNIEYFLAAGDFLTKNAPESVGMAWYAIRLTLTAIHSNYDLYTFFGAGLSDISEIMIIVRHYDRLYDERSKPEWKPSPLVEKLFDDVIGAYAAVLDFSFAVKKHLTPGSLTRIKHGFKDFFGLSKQKFEEKLKAVADFKAKILEGSQGAFQDRTLTQLEGVSTILVGIENSVRHIRDFQETQQRLHQEAMAKFDTMLKGLDDIKASTKRKSRWDYAVQEFKSFQADLSPLEAPIRILSDTIDQIYPGTCQWIFDEFAYQDWSETDKNALLCVTGSEGAGKSFVVASVANSINQEAHSDKALLYVTCHVSTTGQLCTTDSVCRTLLSQLYELAVQGEANVGLLEACNAIFNRAKEAAKAANAASIMPGMQADAGLPDFAEAFSQMAALLKKTLIIVIDGVDKNGLDDKNQEELLGKLRSLVGFGVEPPVGARLRVLVGCGSSSKFFHDLDLYGMNYSYVDADGSNRGDMSLVLADALSRTPGLSSAEQAEAREAILDKARSRFAYVTRTAIPFMREPFQRPLANRLLALPDGVNDTYTRALRKMSPNYLDLLRTALTWSVLSPEYPGEPYAREVMDAFQGIYDIPEEEGGKEEEDGESGFPPISRLEMDQLREATDPFLKEEYDSDGEPWLYQPDPDAIEEFFVKSGEDGHEEEDDEAQLCARCGALRSKTNSLVVDPKKGHLQMALTCVRHLNHPLFQRRAGLIPERSGDSEDGGAEGEDSDGENEQGGEEEEGSPGEEQNPDQADDQDSQAADEDADDDTEDAGSDGVGLALEDSGYESEASVDDEDAPDPDFFEKRQQEQEFIDESKKVDEERGTVRVRYEMQYWSWHVREAEKLWTPEDRAASSDWQALMAELDKLAFDTADVFHAWQKKCPHQRHGGIVLETAKPLHVAAHFGLASWTRHLLDRGEDVNALCGDGFSALQAAASAEENRLEVMKLLLDAGADINAENGIGTSAFYLWLCSPVADLDGLKTLLQYGANPTLPCSTTRFAAAHYFATYGKDPAMLDLLVEHGADVNYMHESGQPNLPPLHLLLGARREVPGELLEAFLKHGADPNSENGQSSRPLQVVCYSGHVSNARILLEAGVVDLDDVDHDGSTACHEAAFFNHYTCLRLVLEAGADPDIADKLGRTALHTAARLGFVESTRLLLEHTKQPNLADKHGWTPLFCATLSKNQDVACLILDALVDRNIPLAEINHPTRSGRTPLRQAANRGFDRVVSTLLGLAARDNNNANKNNNNDSINAQDTKKRMTALHRAAMNGHVAVVRALLDPANGSARADPTLRDAESRTALALARDHWAAFPRSAAHREVVGVLVGAGAAAAGAAGDADLAAACAANGATDLLERLWRLGADLTRRDRFGWTPRELAREFGQREAEAFLKAREAARWRAGAGEMVPRRWGRRFPCTTAVGASSVAGADGTEIVHTSGKRVCVSADRPLPAGLERYYFEITLLPLPSDDPTGQHPRGERDGDEEETSYPELAIGFTTHSGAALNFPGWPAPSDRHSAARSWGYHGDSGNVYFSWHTDFWETDAQDECVEADRFGVGDTVGAGVDRATGEVWFTKNGRRVCGSEGRLLRLETAAEGGGGAGRLVPVVGLCEKVRFVVNFGWEGKEFVWKGEEEEEAEAEDKKEGDGTKVKVVVHDAGKEVVKKVVEATSKEVVVDVGA